MMIVFGVALIGLSLLMIGPSPLLPFGENTVLWNIICLAIHGLGGAFALVPSISFLTDSAIRLGYEDDLPAHSLVSGAWQMVFSSGEVIGPIVGASLTDNVGFAWQTTAIGLFCIFVSLGTSILFFFGFKTHSAINNNKSTESESLLNHRDCDIS
jgi:MFS family permease